MSVPDFQQLDNLITDYVDSGRLAGVVAAIISPETTLHRKVYGQQDVELKTPMAWNSLFRIFSMTKPITSIAAMMLWEEKKFDLDDPVAEYLPAFRDTKILYPDGSRVAAKAQMTIRHLLCHTAGITLPAFSEDTLVPLYLEQGLDGMRSKGDLQGISDRLGRLPVKFEPGTQWAYSMATDIVGRLVEVWGGLSFEEFLRVRILAPLGMTETGFQVAPEMNGRLTTSYAIEEGALGSIIDAGNDSTYLSPPAFPSGSGGLVSTADDYLKFIKMLLNEGELDGHRLLAPETLAMMTCNHLDGDMEDYGAADFNGITWQGIGFGLGFNVVIDPQKAIFPGPAGEFGWTGAAGTVFFVNPALKKAALLLTQYMPSQSYPLRDQFRRAAYEGMLSLQKYEYQHE